MGYTYEEYLRERMKEAKEQQAAYETARYAQAAESAAAVDRAYATAKQQAATQYTTAAKKEMGAYRAMFDANAVDELVARRDAKEAVANTNLANSGLNNTHQTAVSLQRSRADAATRAKRHQAVQSIMQKLDSLRSDYDAKAAQEKAAVYREADSDVQKNLFSLNTAARERAQALFDAQVKREYQASENQKDRDQELALIAAKKDEGEELSLTEQMFDPRYHGTRLAEKGKPSVTAIRVDATNILRRDGNNDAWAFLKQRVNRHYITDMQRQEIMEELGITTPEIPTEDEVKKTVDAFLKEDDAEGAVAYIENLNASYLMDIKSAYKWYDYIGLEPD